MILNGNPPIKYGVYYSRVDINIQVNSDILPVSH